MRKQNESTRTLYLEFHRILDNKIRMITKKVVRQCNFFFCKFNKLFKFVFHSKYDKREGKINYRVKKGRKRKEEVKIIERVQNIIMYFLTTHCRYQS